MYIEQGQRVATQLRVLAKAAKEGGPPPFLEHILFDVVVIMLKPQICFDLTTISPL